MKINFETLIDNFKYSDHDKKHIYASPAIEPVISHVSTEFENLPLAQQYVIFEEYLLYFFNIIYKYNKQNIYIHSGIEDDHGFRELSVYLDECFEEDLGKYKDTVSPELIFTIFYDPDDKRLLSVELWASKDFTTEWGSIGFNSIADAYNTNVLLYNKVLPILKRVYGNIINDTDMHAWYILSGIDLEMLLLDYKEIKNNE